MLGQDEEFPAQLSESVILCFQAETRCLVADPGKDIPTQIMDIIHSGKFCPYLPPEGNEQSLWRRGRKLKATARLVQSRVEGSQVSLL